MDTIEIYEDIMEAVSERTEWEKRQTTWYSMRHGGIRRSSLPYPNAPDLHFPLVDSLIDKAKPFYFQQLYVAQTFASFVSLKQQSGERTSAVGAWFDYRLKQRSNFEREVLTGIDHMLGSGSGLIKMYWDEDNKRLCFDARDPLYVIVPKSTIDINDADWLVDVIHMSVEQYKRNPKFNQDKAFVKSITGKDNTASGSQTKYQEVARREGITIGQDDNQIVLWEIYIRGDDGITVQTISPLQPFDDKKVRDDFSVPYSLGAFSKKDRFPFARFRYEIKDKGWYSSRGITEIVAPFETSMCRMWNSKHETMDYFNKPVFTSDGTYEDNASNVRMLPGQILKKGLAPVEFPSPPISFDQEMQSTRATAEYRLQIPDLGANQSEHLSGKPRQGGGATTATEVNAIIGQSGQADDLRARMFRLDLAELYRMAYAIYLQYDKQSLDYLLNDELSQIDQQALHDSYDIAPNGSADSWNKGLQMQKAFQRLQSFGNNAYVDQGELIKSCIELDDPGLVKRMYRDPKIAQGDQNKLQSLETLLMLNNFGAETEPADDDKVHLQGLGQFGQQRTQEGQPVTPLQAHLFTVHIQAHLGQMQQKKDKQLHQFMQLMQPFLGILAQIQQQGQAQQPGNVVPMGGQQPQGAKSASEKTDPQKNAATLMNSVAQLKKVGVQISDDQLNTLFGEAGMPPLQAPSLPVMPS